MLNRAAYWNTLPDGVAVLEIARPEGAEDAARQFVPLRETTIAGEVAGPLAALRVLHTFGYSRADFDHPIEALYRFPLPGDAAITAVSVRFGEVTIDAELADREQAEAAYGAAKEAGQQAALVTRESPNVFTLRLAGLAPDQPVVITTSYAQLATPTAEGWSLRLPLTTAPRYVREDERGSRAAEGQPLAVLRDPGHRFALALLVRGAGAIASPTHPLAIAEEGAEGTDRRVTLRDGAVVPDRDCVIEWRPQQDAAHPTLAVLTETDRAAGQTYFLATLAPASTTAPKEVSAREAILLVDHSGSMSGAKWEAADWATRRFLGDLTPRDTFALALFHDTTAWFAPRPEAATPEATERATDFLLANTTSGGTNLGVALEQALGLPRDGAGRARHVLIVTDAEVSDADRILRLAEEEARRDTRRRISVLCIDAAPNGYLATALAERGGGVVRFLTSAPEEGDITGALDAILADWAAPTRLDVCLTSEGTTIEGVQGPPAAALSLGDLPASRTIWAIGRLQTDIGPALFRASDARGVVAEARATALPDTALLLALKALFGARRVLALEQLQGAGYDPDELRAALIRLGYDPAVALPPAGGDRKLYQENARTESQGALRALLVAEALRYGLASAETSFVAVRRESGEKVAATVAVANALPAGWSPTFARGGGAMLRMSASFAAPMPAAGRVSEQRYTYKQTGGRSGFFDKLTGVFSSAPPASRAADGGDGHAESGGHDHNLQRCAAGVGGRRHPVRCGGCRHGGASCVRQALPSERPLPEWHPTRGARPLAGPRSLRRRSGGAACLGAAGRDRRAGWDATAQSRLAGGRAAAPDPARPARPLRASRADDGDRAVLNGDSGGVRFHTVPCMGADSAPMLLSQRAPHPRAPERNDHAKARRPDYSAAPALLRMGAPMRVIAGEARGARLKAPEGMRTRPMADKIKESLFSMLMALGIEPERVLDLYAGSGAVGIEALSRSAEWADFVEGRADACAVIRDNLAHTKFTERAAVHQTKVESYLGRRPAVPYDFVIMDPPYADPEIIPLLERLGRSALVAPGTVVVIGHSPRVNLPPALPPLQQLRQRCHGDSCFAIYEVAANRVESPVAGEVAADRSERPAAEGEATI